MYSNLFDCFANRFPSVEQPGGKAQLLSYFAVNIVEFRLSTCPATLTVNMAYRCTQVEMDYSPLKTYLQEADVRKAEDETRALLIKLAGPAAVKRGWVYFTEVQFVPVKDLQTIDNLWKAASNNKFGYSVQVRRRQQAMYIVKLLLSTPAAL